MKKTKLFALLAVVFAGSALVSCGNDTKQLSTLTENKQSVEEKKETPAEEKKETPVEEKKEESKKESVDDGSKKQETSDTITTTITFETLKIADEKNEKGYYSYTNIDLSTDDGLKISGNTIFNENKVIQIRGSKESGLTFSSENGTIKSVRVNFNSQTADGKRTLGVIGSNKKPDNYEQYYGKEEQYTHSFPYTASNTDYFYEFTDSYSFVSIVSKGSAIYLESIEIVWTK